MAAVSLVLSEDQFLCSICLDVFTDPVTTSCGHSFCKTCINKHWDNTDQCQCPVCKKDFSTRPQLNTNTFMSEMVSQFKKKHQVEEDLLSSVSQAAEPGEVMCDVCSEPKLKALKSCLVCLASYCPSHLEPHVTISSWKRHQLIEPVKNLEDRLCSEHEKPLELFCQDDDTLVCLQCLISEHKNHSAVPMKDVCETKQEELRQMIEERRLKIKLIQNSVATFQETADRKVKEGTKIFNDLMVCFEKCLDKFKRRIEEKQKEKEKEAEEMIQEIKTETSELEDRLTEMQELSASEDHLHFVETFTSARPAPKVRDWTEVDIREPAYEGTLTRAVSEMENILLTPKIKKLYQAEIRRVQKSAVKVTLDPATAHLKLVLTLNNKQVHYDEKRDGLYFLDSPERFSSHYFVAGKEKFSSGQFYFEVQVKGKTQWALGIVSESADRKGDSRTNQDGYWYIVRNRAVYYTNGSPRGLHLRSSPEMVGVFVDYEESLISFYDVDNAALIYSFTKCSFTENILPLFHPGDNSDRSNSTPLVLTCV